MESIKIHRGENLQENNFRGVYLIRNLDNRLLKIGKCNNLARRFKEITRSFNFCGVEPKLEIEGFLEYDNEADLEMYLHEQFNEVKKQNEWFEINDIESVIAKIKNFKRKEKPKNDNKKHNIKNKKIKVSKNVEEVKVLNDYLYFEFTSIFSKRNKILRIIWRSKILDIKILEKKISDIMEQNYDIYKICSTYWGDIFDHEIDIVEESLINAFEENNSDCIVEVYKINDSAEKIFDGIYNYYTYLYEDEIRYLYNNLCYYKKSIDIVNNETIDGIKEKCKLTGESVLKYLEKEIKRYSKMFEVYNNPDIRIFIE